MPDWPNVARWVFWTARMDMSGEHEEVWGRLVTDRRYKVSEQANHARGGDVTVTFGQELMA